VKDLLFWAVVGPLCVVWPAVSYVVLGVAFVCMAVVVVGLGKAVRIGD